MVSGDYSAPIKANQNSRRPAKVSGKFTVPRLTEWQPTSCESGAWSRRRNTPRAGVDRHFTAGAARIGLKRLYPKIEK